MSHEPRPAPIAHSLALVVTGGRKEAVAREAALRRYFAAGLERLADDGAADPRAALEALEEGARKNRPRAALATVGLTGSDPDPRGRIP